MRVHKLKAIIISIVLILPGSLIFFYNGYKDNGFIDTISFLLILIGWAINLFLFFGRRLLKNKKVSFKKNKSIWFKQKIFTAFCYFGFGALLVCNVIVVSDLADRRISSILQNGNTQQALAVVIKLEHRNSRGGPKPYAIIKYQTTNKSIEQSLYNGYDPKFLIGQKLLIKYSVDHPEMFEVLSR